MLINTAMAARPRTTGQRRLKWAAGLLIGIGCGHSIAIVVTGGDHLLRWAADGFWAAVPFLGGVQPSATELSGAITFWAGPGGFALPMILLGALIWRQTRRADPPPRWLGCALMLWGLVCGVLLGPSRYSSPAH